MNVCLDACFLIGLYDERDQHHERAVTLFSDLFSQARQNTVILIWPVLYEAISTQLVRGRHRTAAFERDFRTLRASHRLDYLDDAPYREQALDDCFSELSRQPSTYRPLSLTDRVIRSVLEDINVNVDAVLTFNTGDFADVCRRVSRQLID